MRVLITGKNLEITEGINEAVHRSLGKLDKFFKAKEITANVNVKTYAHEQKIEITLRIDEAHVLRQEVVERDLYLALDEAVDKLEVQIKKVKDRANKHHNDKQELLDFFSDLEDQKEKEKRIVRRKKLELKPMSEEEAILQFELVGHDFYLYFDADLETYKVIYKRTDKEYGILEV